MIMSFMHLNHNSGWHCITLNNNQITYIISKLLKRFV